MLLNSNIKFASLSLPLLLLAIPFPLAAGGSNRPTSLPPSLLQRIQSLEAEVAELKALVKGTNENVAPPNRNAHRQCIEGAKCKSKLDCGGGGGRCNSDSGSYAMRRLMGIPINGGDYPDDAHCTCEYPLNSGR